MHRFTVVLFAVAFVTSSLVADVVGTSHAQAALSTLADGVRFVEQGHQSEYISWFGASLPLTASDADAYGAEGNRRVATVPSGYLAAHPAGVFPANRLVRVVGTNTYFQDDGHELLPVSASTALPCAARLGQPRVAVVPASWSARFRVGPGSRCIAVTANGPFTRSAQYLGPNHLRNRREEYWPDPLAPRAVVGDFNGDGRADVLGYVPGPQRDELWFGSPTGFVVGPSVSVYGNYRTLVRDFNGDRIDDILWMGYPFDPNVRFTRLWYGTRGGSSFIHPSSSIPRSPSSTFFSGDVNGDGRTDVLWLAWHSTGAAREQALVVWYGTATGFHVGSSQRAAVGRAALLVGDFDGDHKTDVFWYRPGATALWRGTTTGFKRVATREVYGTYHPIVGDFNGDGRDDIAWQEDSFQAKLRLWYGGPSSFSDGPTTVVSTARFLFPMVGDFNGDGRADIHWWTNFIPQGSPTTFGAANGFVAGPSSADEPGTWNIADYNGDGHDDILWWNNQRTLPRDTQTATMWVAH